MGRPRLFQSEGNRTAEVRRRGDEFARRNPDSGHWECDPRPSGHTDIVFLNASDELVEALTSGGGWHEQDLEKQWEGTIYAADATHEDLLNYVREGVVNG